MPKTFYRMWNSAHVWTSAGKNVWYFATLFLSKLATLYVNSTLFVLRIIKNTKFVWSLYSRIYRLNTGIRGVFRKFILKVNILEKMNAENLVKLFSCLKCTDLLFHFSLICAIDLLQNFELIIDWLHFFTERFLESFFSLALALLKKCPYSEFFWSIFSRIWTE